MLLAGLQEQREIQGNELDRKAERPASGPFARQQDDLAFVVLSTLQGSEAGVWGGQGGVVTSVSVLCQSGSE